MVCSYPMVMNHLQTLNEPTSYHEVMTVLESTKWNVVMEEKMQSIYNNQVLDLVDKSPDYKTFGCK